MKNPINFLLIAVLVIFFTISCQSKKQKTEVAEAAVNPPVSQLNQTRYTIGNPIVLHFAEQTLQAEAHLDSQTSTGINLSQKDSLLMPTKGASIGFHQLIVSGTTSSERSFIDTLTVELLPDQIPGKRTFTVIATYPHNATSFTQGLEFYNGTLYESTGLNGSSRLMRVEPTSGIIDQSVSIPNQYFGEGITIVNNNIYQLTWTSGVCFRYDLNFKQNKTFTYFTQGWGLTHRDTTLIMSDGSNKLYFFTPDFKKQSEVAVYDNTGPVVNLNELEYADGFIFANIWQTNRIAQIDPASGTVVAYLDMQSILPATVNTNENVLNGIAYQPQEKAFYVTGKNWPTMTRIRLNSISQTKQKTLTVIQ